MYKRDEVVLAEIELTGRLMAAVADRCEPLTTEQIDELLGVCHPGTQGR